MADTSIHTSPTEAKAGSGKKRRKSVADNARAVTESAKSKVDDAVKSTVQALDENPFGAIAGAIAAGAVAAAMIPATRRELEALGPWTEKMRDALSDAFAAAKEAGAGELTAAGLTMAAASDGVGGMVGKIVKAATAASTAAASSVKGGRAPAAAPAAPEVDPVPAA
jgi:hypothetical protein